MRIKKMLGVASAVVSLASVASAATITGTIKAPDGAPFRGAFVEARNAKTRVTIMVLSDSEGRYRVENLPAGNYQVLAKAIGYQSDPRTGIFLAARQNASFDWTLQKQMVRWTDIPIFQGFKLMPDGRGKARFVQSCGASCHGFEQMIEVSRDENGWRESVRDMQQIFGGGVIGQF